MNWWSRNRWGLVLTVPALAAMTLTSMFRVFSGYLDNQLSLAHPPTGFVQIDHDYTGAEIRREVSISLVKLDRLDATELKTPPGTQAWLLTTALESPVGTNLLDCRLALIDAQGRSYASDPSLLGVTGAASRVTCDAKPPERAPADWTRTEPRWTKTWLFLLPADAEPDWLRLSWGPPDFIRLPLR